MTRPALPRLARRPLLRGVVTLGGLGALGLASACNKPTAGGLVIFTASSPELAMASLDPESGSWQSAPWAADGVTWLPYPPRGQIQLEHALGRVPQTVLVYLSFTRDGASPGLAAGDLARVVDADLSTVTVWNDTNGSYFARVVVA